MTTVYRIVRRARRELHETTGNYWTDQDLIDALNDSLNWLYKLMPSVFEVTEPVVLIEGEKQVLPRGSRVLFDVIRNKSHRNKRAITLMDRELLDRTRPRWRGESLSDEIQHYTYTSTEAESYEVYPPSEAGVEVILSFAEPVREITIADLGTNDSASTFISNVDNFEDAIFNHVVHGALRSAQETSPAAVQLVDTYLNYAAALVIGEASGRLKSDPNVTMPQGRLPTSAS